MSSMTNEESLQAQMDDSDNIHHEEITRLRTDLDALRKLNGEIIDHNRHLCDELAKARADVARLRAVVERCASGHFACSSMELAREAYDATPTAEPTVPLPKRDGNWMDRWGACKVCGGEIPHGHMDDCDIYKLELAKRESLSEAESLATAIEGLLEYVRKQPPDILIRDHYSLFVALAAFRIRNPKP